MKYLRIEVMQAKACESVFEIVQYLFDVGADLHGGGIAV